jgi:hypothetical protein
MCSIAFKIALLNYLGLTSYVYLIKDRLILVGALEAPSKKALICSIYCASGLAERLRAASPSGTTSTKT